jgi:hypothetical protein
MSGQDSKKADIGEWGKKSIIQCLVVNGLSITVLAAISFASIVDVQGRIGQGMAYIPLIFLFISLPFNILSLLLIGFKKSRKAGFGVALFPALMSFLLFIAFIKTIIGLDT